MLDNENIAIRVGHHCAQPTMIRFNVSSTARVSFGAYNDENDIKKVDGRTNKYKGIIKLNEKKYETLVPASHNGPQQKPT